MTQYQGHKPKVAGQTKEEAEAEQRQCLSPDDPARSSMQEPSIPLLPKLEEVLTGSREM